MSRMVKIALKIVLIAVIPTILLGFNLLERTPMYKSFLGTGQVEKALKTRFLTQYGEPGQLILGREAHPDEFGSVLDLIRANSSAKLPDKQPHWISRLAIENGAFVSLPTGRKAVLIPEASPLFAFFCPRPIEQCPEDEAILVGTVADLRSWAREKEDSTRLGVDVGVSLISILVGLLIEFRVK